MVDPGATAAPKTPAAPWIPPRAE